MEGRQGNKVGFVKGLEVEEAVPDLLNVDCAGKGGFLGVVALQL